MEIYSKAWGRTLVLSLYVLHRESYDYHCWDLIMVWNVHVTFWPKCGKNHSVKGSHESLIDLHPTLYLLCRGASTTLLLEQPGIGSAIFAMLPM